MSVLKLVTKYNFPEHLEKGIKCMLIESCSTSNASYLSSS